MPARAAGLEGTTSATSRPPAGGDSSATPRPMNLRGARALPGAGLEHRAARRGRAEVDLDAVHRALDDESPPGAEGSVTITSPWNVVCAASSPRPQKRDSSPSVKIIETLSVESWALSTVISASARA